MNNNELHSIFYFRDYTFQHDKKRRQKQILQVADGVFGNSNFQSQHPGDHPEGKRSRKPQVRFIGISR